MTGPTHRRRAAEARRMARWRVAHAHTCGRDAGDQFAKASDYCAAASQESELAKAKGWAESARTNR